MIVDQRSNVVVVSYKPNTHFDPAVIRKAAEEADAAIVLLQIVARGRVIDEGPKHFFLAGEDRFLLIEPAAGATPLPPASETLLFVVGSIDDSVEPIRLKIVQSGPAE